MFQRQRERKGGEDRRESPRRLVHSQTNALAGPRLAIRAGNSIRVSHVAGKAQPFGPSLLPPGLCLEGELSQGAEPGVGPRCSPVGCGRLQGQAGVLPAGSAFLMRQKVKEDLKEGALSFLGRRGLWVGRATCSGFREALGTCHGRPTRRREQAKLTGPW